MEAACKALHKKGKLNEAYKFITIGGDGGTYDIGFQSLSGAMERGHDMVYFCYDNEAYMNTGIQRSSSTPRFANATTTPVGTESLGKKQEKKDLTVIMAAHNIPYVAQTTFIGNFKDFHEKAHRAIYTPGPAFVNVMAPCPRGWQYSAELLPQICKMAVETCVWPLYEVVEGKWILSYEPKKKLPVEEFMRLQGRFKHCFKPGNEWTIEAAQDYVDRKWAGGSPPALFLYCGNHTMMFCIQALFLMKKKPMRHLTASVPCTRAYMGTTGRSVNRLRP